MTIEPTKYYNMTQSAELLKMSRTKLYGYVNNNTIRTERIKRNGVVRQAVKGTEIIKFINNHIIFEKL